MSATFPMNQGCVALLPFDPKSKETSFQGEIPSFLENVGRSHQSQKARFEAHHAPSNAVN
jgi:hypothetical protein